MSSEPSHPRSQTDDAGPQGTQVFSRDQIAGILDETATSSDHGDRARLFRVGDPSASPDPPTYPLGSDRMTIGRSSVCDICIEEPSLSSEHARLVRSEDGWRIINLLSTNGVFVNDDKVFSHRLDDGDTIRLGRIQLRFRDPSQDAVRSGRGSTWGSTGTWLLMIAIPLAAAMAALWLLQ